MVRAVAEARAVAMIEAKERVVAEPSAVAGTKSVAKLVVKT